MPSYIAQCPRGRKITTLWKPVIWVDTISVFLRKGCENFCPYRYLPQPKYKQYILSSISFLMQVLLLLEESMNYPSPHINILLALNTYLGEKWRQFWNGIIRFIFSFLKFKIIKYLPWCLCSFLKQKIPVLMPKPSSLWEA